jgi:hypothetical protein
MKWLMSLIVGTCLYLPTLSHTQVIQHQISDDGYARVPLQFAFPYYGRVFTESYMFSNGVVGFLNPTNNFCCSGFDLRNNNGTPFSFAIMPLQTDLLNYSGRFLTEGTTEYQRYAWENISEFGRPENLNTFGVEIRPSGYIGMHYEKVNISPNRPITMGMTGDVGEYTQYYHGAGFTTNTPFSYITESTGNQCLLNPLSNSSCAGYQEAYLAQQCSVSSLYSPQCPNYEQAYLEQQCSLNALYSTSCQGYEQAYFNSQCSLSPLYNQNCNGYAQAYFNQQCSINALFNKDCQGYEAAYFNQQCSLNPLYNQGCTGYAEAYFAYQCTQSPLYNSQCQGYEQAYLAQQCGISQLYSASCPNYQQAYFNQQCSLNSLYSTSCPNYQQAYFAEQCRLNPLYDRNCSGYAEAYALANVIAPSAPATVVITSEPQVVADPVVNQAIATPSPTSQTSPTSVIARQTASSQATSQLTSQTEKKEEKKEAKKEHPKTHPKAPIKAAVKAPEVGAVVVDRPIPQSPQIVDLLYLQIVKKPIQDNGKAFYFLTKNSQIKHEEMVDGQYRK